MTARRCGRRAVMPPLLRSAADLLRRALVVAMDGVHRKGSGSCVPRLRESRA